MLLSLFTPTNDPKYLNDAYDSLLVQQYPDFEWVLVPNGDMTSQIPERILQDSRVRVVPGPQTDKIGALKKFACDHCTGEAFIEYDHDDLLVPNTLPKIAAAIKAGAGFVYSDVAVFNEGSMDSWGYHPSYGWKHYPLRVYDKSFVATACFPLTPRMLCEVYYAPDHVRVWSKAAYQKTGGHNVELSVCDDHDLICRTYLAGVPFQHIGCCGYLYRFHKKNTVKARQKDIVANSMRNRGKYLRPLITEWCKRESLPSLDLAAESARGALPLDAILTSANTSYGVIDAREVLQRVAPDKQVDFFNKAYDRLIPGGYLTLTVPSERGRYATQDPRHLTRFNVNSFHYYTDKVFADMNPAIRSQFQAVHYEEYYPTEWHKKHEMLVLRYDMVALKGQWHPGPKPWPA